MLDFKAPLTRKQASGDSVHWAEDFNTGNPQVFGVDYEDCEGKSISSEYIDQQYADKYIFSSIKYHAESTERKKTYRKFDPRKYIRKKSTIDRLHVLTEREWHMMSAGDLFQRFESSPERGLTEAQATARLAKGANALKPYRHSVLRRGFSCFFGGFGLLVAIATVLSFLSWKPFGDTEKAIFKAWQEHITSRALRSITDLVGSDTFVLRDGHGRRLPSVELVPGDLVKITMGSKIAADMRLVLASSDLSFDRTMLTGESDLVFGTTEIYAGANTHGHNMALQGTLCTSGNGVGIVVNTGENTVFGNIATLASRQKAQPTMLEAEIRKFVIVICALAVLFSFMWIILWVAWLRIQRPEFMSLSDLLINLVSLLVSFIPEGLPICITLGLTILSRQLYAKEILCKSLATVETLGTVDIVLSDKTGTLTAGRMRVTDVSIGKKNMSTADVLPHCLTGYGKDRSPLGRVVNDLAAIAAVCNDSFYVGPEPLGDDEKEEEAIHGNPTDAALLRYAHLFGPISQYREEWIELSELTFNSDAKFSAKLLKPRRSSMVPAGAQSSPSFTADCVAILAKGAPEILLRRCTHYCRSNGTIASLDSEATEMLMKSQEVNATAGNRVILLARKTFPLANLHTEMQEGKSMSDMVNGMTVVGLLSLSEPPKHDSAKTVDICRRAGMRFLIVTGDLGHTAKVVGQKVGILTVEPVGLEDLKSDIPVELVAPYCAGHDSETRAICLSGDDLTVMNESQWMQCIAFDEIIFARTTPQQKLDIVQRFQQNGHSCAVTGDGVNDATALKAADIGIAMGSGSEIAMEAADLVLLKDFSGLVTATLYGRLCFENLKKLTLYLLPSGSFSELIPMFLNIAAGLPEVLNPFQMILICIGTDILPALALIFENPEKDLLFRAPRKQRKEKLIDWKLLLHAYFFLGLFQSLFSLIIAFYFGFSREGINFSDLFMSYGKSTVDAQLLEHATQKSQSIYFFSIVLSQWGNLLSTRTRRLSIIQHFFGSNGKGKNLFIIPAMLAGPLIAILVSFVPVLQEILGTRPIGFESFIVPISFAIGILILDELRKLAVRSYPNSLLAKIAW